MEPTGDDPVMASEVQRCATNVIATMCFAKRLQR